MAQTESKFMYNIDISYISGDDEYDLDYKTINVLSIIYNYDQYNQPLILLSMNIKSSILNKMKKRSKIDKIYLKIQKYDANAKTKMMKTYIEEQFAYYFPNMNLDYSEDVDSAAIEDNTQSNSYTKIQIGLLKTELVNNIKKKIYNGVYNDGDIMSVVLDNLPNAKNTVVEQFDNKKSIKNLMIPPISGISELLKFLNKRYTFYKTGYRFFMDYKKTFLISKKGKAIDLKDGTYNTIKIEIKDNLSDGAHTVGMVADSENKLYIIPVDLNNTTTSINRVSEKEYNNIYAIDSNGNTISEDIDVHKSKDSEKISKVYRVADGNMDYVKAMKYDIELSSSIISVVKADLDNSVISINKNYQIEHYDKYKSQSGNYIILQKEEVYTQQDGDFRCSTMISLAKLKS